MKEKRRSKGSVMVGKKRNVRDDQIQNVDQRPHVTFLLEQEDGG